MAKRYSKNQISPGKKNKDPDSGNFRGGLGEYNTGNLEMNSYDPEIELGKTGKSFDLNEPSPSLESSKGADEFSLPENKNPPKEKKRNGFATKLIASLATVATGVGAIMVSTAPPPDVKPSVISVEVIDFRESQYVPSEDGITDEIIIPPEYDVGFTFALGDYSALAVSITGEAYELSPGDTLFPEGGTVETDGSINCEIAAEELQLNGDGTVTAIYTVSDIYLIHELKATLSYTKKPPDQSAAAEAAPEEASQEEAMTLESEIFHAKLPRFNNVDVESKNTIEYSVVGDKINLTVRFGDFEAGCFDFRTVMLEFTYGPPMLNGQTLVFGEGGDSELVIEMIDGVPVWQTTVDKIEAESLDIYILLRGESYYNDIIVDSEYGHTGIEKNIVLN